MQDRLPLPRSKVHPHHSAGCSSRSVARARGAFSGCFPGRFLRCIGHPGGSGTDCTFRTHRSPSRLPLRPVFCADAQLLLRLSTGEYQLWLEVCQPLVTNGWLSRSFDPDLHRIATELSEAFEQGLCPCVRPTLYTSPCDTVPRTGDPGPSSIFC